ncbi:MAG: hypothetical protein ACI909_002125 [Planctomycetota bacterium]|jgi:hypothetical protein
MSEISTSLNRKTSYLFSLKVGFYCLFLFCITSNISYAAYETLPVIRMSDVLTSQQAQSLYHRVEDIVLDGKFYNFRVESEIGSYNITSLALFRNRIEEISTLAQAINQFNKEDDSLSEELSGQFSIRANSAIDILSRPVESAANLAGQIAENLDETLNRAPSDSTIVFGYLGGELKDPVAAMHKRNIASQWGLDVYSSDLRVQEFLNAVTKARSSGKISAGTPTLRNQIARPAKAANIEIEANTAYLLKSKSVDELNQINLALLTAMNINKDIANKFLKHAAFSPRHKTRISHYLDALSGVRNRSAFIEAANQAKNEVMALAFDEGAMMLNYYHNKIASLETLYAGSEVLEAISLDRRIVYFVPVDLIYWSEQTEQLFDSLLQRAKQSGFETWELVTAGSVSEEASLQLLQRKFTLRERFVNK